MDRLFFTGSGRGGRRALAGAAALLFACLLASAPAAGARRASPALAPAIAFVKGHHIWKVSADGSGLKQLTRGSAEDESPAWSADRGTVAFVRMGSSSKVSPIYTVPAAGGSATLLYRDSLPKVSYISVTGLAYSPDGTQLAFADVYASKTAQPVGCRLVTVDLATGESTVLLDRNGGFGRVLVTAWHLSWSPDGKALLISQSGQDEEGGQTWRYTLAGGALSRIPVANASYADWAADSQSILVSTSTQARTSVKHVNVDGSVIHTLATGGGWRGRPSVYGARYSPGGETVVYTVGWQSLWLMNADGTGKHKLTPGSAPAWR